MAMTLEKGWHQALDEELKKPYIQELKTFLSEEKKQDFSL